MRLSSCTTQKPPGVVTHAKPEEAASHSPGATHQPHVPHNVTFPRLPQQEHRKRGRQRQRGGKVRAKVSRQELDKGKTRGQTSQVGENTRRRGDKEWKEVRREEQRVGGVVKTRGKVR